MNTKNRNGLFSITFAALLLLFACEQKATRVTIPESLAGIKDIVAGLDSTVNSMYGWEPSDSTYNRSIDTLVANIMNSHSLDQHKYSLPSEETLAVNQKAYDEARITWAEFKRLIYADNYEKALNYYLCEGDDDGKKNAGDFLVFLKHSTQRYVFFSKVLFPLMQEYKGNEYALKEYIDLLQFEKAMEEVSIDIHFGIDNYTPEVYPYVILDLGRSLVKIGKMDEAQELFDDMLSGIYGLTEDALLANYVGTKYAAELYLIDGKPDWALATWDYFKEYMEENKTDYDEKDFARCMARIDEEMSTIHNKE